MRVIACVTPNARRPFPTIKRRSCAQVVVFDGSYSDYEGEKKRLLGDGYQPHRIQFKKLKA